MADNYGMRDTARRKAGGLASTQVSGRGYDKDVVGSTVASKQRGGFGLRQVQDKAYGSANAAGRGVRGPALGS